MCQPTYVCVLYYMYITIDYRWIIWIWISQRLTSRLVTFGGTIDWNLATSQHQLALTHKGTWPAGRPDFCLALTHASYRVSSSFTTTTNTNIYYIYRNIEIQHTVLYYTIHHFHYHYWHPRPSFHPASHGFVPRLAPLWSSASVFV